MNIFCSFIFFSYSYNKLLGLHVTHDVFLTDIHVWALLLVCLLNMRTMYGFFVLIIFFGLSMGSLEEFYNLTLEMPNINKTMV